MRVAGLKDKATFIAREQKGRVLFRSVVRADRFDRALKKLTGHDAAERRKKRKVRWIHGWLNDRNGQTLREFLFAFDARGRYDGELWLKEKDIRLGTLAEVRRTLKKRPVRQAEVPPGMRFQIATLALREKEKGVAILTTAKKIGLVPVTLTRWVNQLKAKKAQESRTSSPSRAMMRAPPSSTCAKR